MIPKFNHAFEATKFHENAFGIMFGGSLAGMFDIAFGTLTAGLGDYSVAPTVQLSTTFLKGIPTGATVRTEVEAVSTGKTIMNFVGKAYVGEELVGSASGTFIDTAGHLRNLIQKNKEKGY